MTEHFDPITQISMGQQPADGKFRVVFVLFTYTFSVLARDSLRYRVPDMTQGTTGQVIRTCIDNKLPVLDYK